MTARIFSQFFLLTLITTSTAWAAAPLTFTYAGQVFVKGAAYEGNGFFRFALVNFDCTNVATADSTKCATAWSNDGSSSLGSEPLASVELIVSNGKFSVDIGDATIAGMDILRAKALGTPMYLRTWFDDRKNGSELLLPDYKLNSVPYAVFAGNAIGIDQTWQLLTRSYGTTYTNTTGRPITVKVSHTNDLGYSLILYIGGLVVDKADLLASGGTMQTVSAVVPDKQTYRVLGPSNRGSMNWVELR